MKTKSIGVFWVLLLLLSLPGTEYFIGKHGKDSNPGTSESAPWGTLQYAVKKLVPGDTLTILPGEYVQEATFEYAGDLERPTVIQAKIPGSVHLRGDVPTPPFTKVQGRRNVYMCQVEKMPEYVLERDTVQKYKRVPSVSEVENTPGSSFFDLKNKRVYVQTSDGLAPENHCVTFSILRGDAIRIRSPKLKNFHVRGIMFSGYNSATSNGIYRSTFGGVYMPNPVKCTVKDCIVYLCGSGVTMVRFADSAVEDCVFFANSTEFNGSGGNLLCYGPGKTTVQRNIITFASGMAGQRFYGGVFDRCLVENCFSFDNKYGDIWIKYASDTSWVKGSYASSLLRSRLIENCIFTTGDTYYHGAAKNSICRSREPEFDPRKEFADPDHLDFRLLKNSRFRKGGDRGVRGYDPKVVFDDEAKLVSGGTLYFTKAQKKALKFTGLENIIIRGRGVMAVPLKGTVTFENCKNVRIENVNMLDKVEFKNCSGVLVRRCAFLKEVTLPAESQVRHNLFAGTLKGADGGFLRGNIFCTSYSGKPEFSGWNAYVKGEIPAFETASWKAPAPLFNNAAAGDFTLKNHAAFAGKSGDGFPNGQYRYDTVYVREGMGVEKGVVSAGSATFFVRSAANSETRAVLTAPEGKRVVKSEIGEGEYVISFTGLRPGSSYKVDCAVMPRSVKRLTNAPRSSGRAAKFTLSFTTRTQDSPRIWYVSNQGDNANDGTSFDKALAEINVAVKRAAPGDTVLIKGGTYRELVRVTGTGNAGKYLTIAGAPGEEVFIDGGRMLYQGVLIRGQEYVRVDNLRINYHAGSGAIPGAGGVVVRNSANIHLKRIFYDNRRGSNERSFIGYNVKNMLIENSVAITPFGGYEFWKCPDLEIRNSVFFRGKTINGRIGTSMTEPAHVHHCIFIGQEIQKVNNPPFGASEIATFKENDNGFFARLPRAEKPIIGFNSFNGRSLPQNDGSAISKKEWKRQGRFYNQMLTYDEFCKAYNRKDTALFGDPKMKALPFYHQFTSLAEWYDQFVLGKGGKKIADKFRESRARELREKEKLHITDFIATNPEFLKRNIGLEPSAFKNR